MEITRLEKAALITTGAAAAYKTLLWSVHARVDSTEPWIIALQWSFALVSFAAFDLVLMAVVARGWSWHGALALLVASVVSGAIGLEVGRAEAWPALHAAPAVTLAMFGLHLMLSGTTTTITAPEQPSVTNTQINIGTLPRTFADFAAARARELPDATPAQLAALLETNEPTIRKLLDRAGVVIEAEV
jgi:hypothetical protein